MAVAGIVAALTGVAMSLSYGEDGVLLTVLRVVFGTAMAAAIVLAVMAVRRRDIARHRAWMIRGYALGIAAGTQALVFVPWLLLVGTPGPTTTALLMGAGWVIDLVVAEWLIRRRPPRTPVAARPVRIRPATTGVVR